jgi:hypothetical protein
MALQTLLIHWLQRFRVPKKRGRGAHHPNAAIEDGVELLAALKRNRLPMAVWWEARVVRVWTWPPDDANRLTRVVRQLLDMVVADAADGGGAGATSCTHPSTINSPADICRSCTRSLFGSLFVDYKCIELRSVGGEP